MATRHGKKATNPRGRLPRSGRHLVARLESTPSLLWRHQSHRRDGKQSDSSKAIYGFEG